MPLSNTFLRIHGMDVKYSLGLLLILVVFTSPILVKGQSGRAKFTKTYHYLGNVKEQNGEVSHRYTFKNTGSDSLLIKQVKLSCGCTEARYSRDPIAPGDTASVQVVYDPANRPGTFKKPAYVYTNGSPARIVLTLAGQVIPRPKGPRDYYPFLDGNIRFKTNHLTYGYLADNKTKRMSTILYNAGEKAIRFDLSETEIPPYLALTLSKTILEPGDTLKLAVRYSAELKKDWGFLFDEVYLKTDDSNRPMKRLNVSAHIREHFSSKERTSAPALKLSSSKLDFGKVTQGEFKAVPLTIANHGKSDLKIRKLSSACPCLEFKGTEEAIPPGTSREILVIFNTRGRIGHQEKDFQLISNDPKNSELLVQLKIEIVR